MWDIDVENAYSIEKEQDQTYSLLIMNNFFINKIFIEYLLSVWKWETGITNLRYLSSNAQNQLGNMVAQVVKKKNSPANAADMRYDWIPGLGRSPGVGNANPF